MEHWWNGSWGRLARRDFYLRRNPVGGQWEVEVRELSRSLVREYATEDQAREVLRQLLDLGGDYKRIDNIG